MKRWIGAMGVLGLLGGVAAWGQSAIAAPVLRAHTVIVLNQTHTPAVEDGAEAELKEWGHLKLVETTDEADIVLQFDKQNGHTFTSSSPGDGSSGGDGKSYGGGMTFGSSIRMTATTKDGVAPFFTTKTDAGKEKAGRECVQTLIRGWQDAQRRATAAP